MRKSRWLLLGLLIAGSAVLVVLPRLSQSAVTKENFERSRLKTNGKTV